MKLFTLSASAAMALRVAVATVALAVTATPSLADEDEQARTDAATACEDAAALLRDDDLDGALEEARWCLESLQQIRQGRTLAIFPDQVDGWSGGELDQQSAMGMTILSRSYSRDGTTVDITLTSGAAAGGLAALAQMGMALGSANGRKIRVQKRTVIDMSDQEGNGANFMVQLRSGGMLTVESADADPDTVLGFLRAFPIVAVDDALAD